MRHQIVSHEGWMKAHRASDVIDSDAAPFRERLNASADGLLSLAAAPTFAIMALLTGIQGGGMPDMLCLAAGNGLPLSGMSLMYSLMSVFHLGPWLKLIARRRSGAHRSAHEGLQIAEIPEVTEHRAPARAGARREFPETLPSTGRSNAWHQDRIAAPATIRRTATPGCTIRLHLR